MLRVTLYIGSILFESMKLEQLFAIGVSMIGSLNCGEPRSYSTPLVDGRELSVSRSIVSPLIFDCGPLYGERNVVSLQGNESGVYAFVDMDQDWKLESEDYVLKRVENGAYPEGQTICLSVGSPSHLARNSVKHWKKDFEALGQYLDISLLKEAEKASEDPGLRQASL